MEFVRCISKSSWLSSGRRSCDVTRTSFVTKIWLQDATTVGQKIGMEAHMMAKSISRLEKIRGCGYQNVKSKLVVATLLCLKVLQRRRMAIRTTLGICQLGFRQVWVCECRDTYIDPRENRPVIASNCLRLRSDRKNSVKGTRKMAMSRIMFVEANARIKFFASRAVRKPKP